MSGKTIHVPSGDSCRVEAPDVAIARGLGPCIGVGILNERNKIGYLWHFGNRPRGISIIDDVAREMANVNDLRVKLAAGIPPLPFKRMEESDWKDFFSRRLLVVKKLLEIGIHPEQIDSFELANSFGCASKTMVVSPFANTIEVI